MITDEMMISLVPRRPPKMLTAAPEMINDLPQLDSCLSFLPLLRYLKERRSTVPDVQAGFYEYLINKLEAEPTLLCPVKDVQVLQEHTGFLELLSTLLFPIISRQEKAAFAFAAPYQFRVFYCSDHFRKLFVDEKEEGLLLPANAAPGVLKRIHATMMYSHVLEKYYGIRLNDSAELVYTVADSRTGLKKYYRIRYDNRFIEVHPKDTLPPIRDCAVCLNTFRILDLEEQLKKMPLDLFEVEGFSILTVEDVTAGEATEAIKRILLQPGDGGARTVAGGKRADRVRMLERYEVDVCKCPCCGGGTLELVVYYLWKRGNNC